MNTPMPNEELDKRISAQLRPVILGEQPKETEVRSETKEEIKPVTTENTPEVQDPNDVSKWDAEHLDEGVLSMNEALSEAAYKERQRRAALAKKQAHVKETNEKEDLQREKFLKAEQELKAMAKKGNDKAFSDLLSSRGYGFPNFNVSVDVVKEKIEQENKARAEKTRRIYE